MKAVHLTALKNKRYQPRAAPRVASIAPQIRHLLTAALHPAYPPATPHTSRTGDTVTRHTPAGSIDASAETKKYLVS